MIVNEKQLEGMANVELNKGDIRMLMDTIRFLWPVARAARKWTNASAGMSASVAESELVDVLEILRLKEME